MRTVSSQLLLIGALTLGTAQAATISGTVTETGSGLPIAGATVAFSDVEQYFGFPQGQAITDAAGNYTLTFSVPGPMPMSVVLEVVAPTHAPQRFGDVGDTVDCFWLCELEPDFQPDLSGMFAVSDSDMLTRDFVLDPGATVAGTVTAAAGGQLEFVPLSFYTDEAYESPSALRQVPVTDASGNYTTPIALKPGTYFAGAGQDNFIIDPLPYGNFVSQAHGGFDCEFLSCAIHSSTPIVVGATPVGGVDFALAAGGEVTGQVLDAGTALPLVAPEHVIMRVWTPDEGRTLATFFVQNATSSFLLQGLSGKYIIEIDPQPSLQTNLLRILNDGRLCPFAGCDRSQGVPLTIAPGSPISMDFGLNRGGKVDGVLTEAVGGLPIVVNSLSVNMAIVDAAGKVYGGGVIEPGGAFVTADGIVPGDYFVTTSLPFTAKSLSGQDDNTVGKPYVDQLFLGVDCPGLACDLSDPGAMPVTVTSGGVAMGVDFSLNVGNPISGTVTAAAGGAPLADRNVEIFTPSGRRVALELTDSSGDYATGGLPDGNYRVVVKDGGRVSLGRYGSSGLGYFGKVFGNPANCMQQLCDPGTGANVTVSGAAVGGIDFALDSGPTISGQVIDTVRGLPVLLTVDVFDLTSNLVGSWSTVTSTDATYTTGAMFPGTYTLVPRTTRTYTIGSPATVPRKGGGIPGSLMLTVTDTSIGNATMGVFQNLVFAADFESN